MRKINYRLVYNRKKKLNKEGKALIQVEAYLEKRRFTFRHIYIYFPDNGTQNTDKLFHTRKKKN